MDLFLSVRSSFGCLTRAASTTPCTPPALPQATSNPTLSPLHSETWCLSGKPLALTNCLASSFPTDCSCSRNLAVDNLPFTNHTQPRRRIGLFLNQPFYPNFLPSLTATRPRRQISYNLEPLGINAPLGEVLEQKEPFALYHTNRKLTLEPKVSREEDNNSSSLIPAPPPQ